MKKMRIISGASLLALLPIVTVVGNSLAVDTNTYIGIAYSVNADVTGDTVWVDKNGDGVASAGDELAVTVSFTNTEYYPYSNLTYSSRDLQAVREEFYNGQVSNGQTVSKTINFPLTQQDIEERWSKSFYVNYINGAQVETSRRVGINLTDILPQGNTINPYTGSDTQVWFFWDHQTGKYYSNIGTTVDYSAYGVNVETTSAEAINETLPRDQWIQFDAGDRLLVTFDLYRPFEGENKIVAVYDKYGNAVKSNCIGRAYGTTSTSNLCYAEFAYSQEDADWQTYTFEGEMVNDQWVSPWEDFHYIVEGVNNTGTVERVTVSSSNGQYGNIFSNFYPQLTVVNKDANGTVKSEFKTGEPVNTTYTLTNYSPMTFIDGWYVTNDYDIFNNSESFGGGAPTLTNTITKSKTFSQPVDRSQQWEIASARGKYLTPYTQAETYAGYRVVQAPPVDPTTPPTTPPTQDPTTPPVEPTPDPTTPVPTDVPSTPTVDPTPEPTTPIPTNPTTSTPSPSRSIPTPKPTRTPIPRPIIKKPKDKPLVITKPKFNPKIPLKIDTGLL